MSETAYDRYTVLALTAKAGEKGAKLRDVIRDAGLDENKCALWLKGTEYPTKEDVSILCKYLGCTEKDLNKMVPAQQNASNYKEETSSVSLPTPEFTEPVKKEKTEEAKKDVPAKKEKAAEFKEVSVAKKPATQNTDRKPRTSRKANTLQFSAETDTIVRKSAGLKKSDEITPDAVMATFNKLKEEMEFHLKVATGLNRDIITTLYKANNQAATEERFAPLLKEAETASEEGLQMAIAILKKFKK